MGKHINIVDETDFSKELFADMSLHAKLSMTNDIISYFDIDEDTNHFVDMFMQFDFSSDSMFLVKLKHDDEHINYVVNTLYPKYDIVLNLDGTFSSKAVDFYNMSLEYWKYRYDIANTQPIAVNVINSAMNTEAIQARISEILADERLLYPVANVTINAPLAMIQVQLTTELHTLERVLGKQLTNINKLRNTNK